MRWTSAVLKGKFPVSLEFTKEEAELLLEALCPLIHKDKCLDGRYVLFDKLYARILIGCGDD
jgi:hypothetical protein